MDDSCVKGILIPIGGNEDKGSRNELEEAYSFDFVGDGILSHVVKQAGGLEAKIVVIPAASSIPEEVAQNYIDAFEKLGCTNIHILHILKKEDSENPINIELIQSANAVMFSGGNQSKITKKMLGTTIHRVMLDKFINEPFVIAGTSAGAMVMSHQMIAGGTNKDSFRKGVVDMGKGLGFIPELIIDSHFIRRGRFGRLTEAVAKFPDLIGVGLAEDTGIIIRNKREFQVIGSGMAIVFDLREATHNYHEILEFNTPMTVVGMKTHVLSNGDRFEIDTRTIKVLPMNEAFV
ncbi:cyanophycinase [Brumimicrobium mesophilum]|uniref:cyanophycinase n=1 Tax=Brumimicrobium mesophilum TaxID=392717 RepID=UPI000D13FEA2|nr:cyanophycinase [Brumimicrobium mesophilum]